MTFFVIKAPVSRVRNGEGPSDVKLRQAFNSKAIQGEYINRNLNVVLEMDGQQGGVEVKLAPKRYLREIKIAKQQGQVQDNLPPKDILLEEKDGGHKVSADGVISVGRESIAMIVENSGSAYDTGQEIRPATVHLKNGSQFVVSSFDDVMDQIDGGENYRAEHDLTWY